MANQIFLHCKTLFENHSMCHFRASGEYSKQDLRLDKLLLLSDRMLSACDGHPHHGRVASEVRQRLGKLLSVFESGGDTIPPAIDLLAKLEIWLKSILWIVRPQKWEAAHQRSEQAKGEGKASRFNLYQVIQELDLLSEQEIQTPIEQYAEIPDSVRQMILCAKEDRNIVEHEGSQIPHYVRQRLLSSSLVSYLAPIIRYQSELQFSLRGVITLPPDFGSLASLARQIDSERRGHIERFAGREEWLETLTEKLTGKYDQEGGYILLTATEGTGKSAIVSMLSQKWASALPILGSHSTHVQKVAPWLPAVILHLGKASNLPSEIVPFLLEQIRCQLVSQFPFSGEVFPESKNHDGMDQELRRIGRDGSLSKRNDYTITEGGETSYLVDTGRESSARSSGYMLARRFLFDALEKLVAETGRVVLLIDALEEISSDGSNLGFLPERLPPGVSCLLTSRPQTSAESFVRSRLKNLEPIELKQLKRNEIPLLSNVSDQTPKGKEFNDRVMESSDGLPLLVSGIGRHVLQENDFTKVPVRGVRDRHFELKAKEWSDSGEVNLHILGLLSIFEPAMPIDLAEIQAYLESQNISVELAEIRLSLKPVLTQLQGLDISRVKLAMRPFAEYVRERYFSPKDLFVRFKRVVDWLISDEDVDPDVFGRLFMAWTNIQSLTEKKSSLSKTHKELLEKLPSILLESGRADLLYRSASRFKREAESVHPIAIACLRNAALLGSLDAMRSFSDLIDEELSEELKVEAIEWVQKGAEQGDAASMMIIGNRLIDGTGMESNVSLGFDWLRKSAESGYARSMMSLGLRLVYGDGLDKMPVEGLKWLKDACAKNYAPADYMIGQILLHCEEVTQDIGTGVAHLEKAAESGLLLAIRFLSSCYVNGVYVEKNVDRGVALLEKAISLDDETAVLSLAHRYFIGDSVEKCESKGLAILESGVAKNQTLAKRALGYELITGKNISKTDYERGSLLLEDAIASGDVPSMEILADFLLDERKSETDKAKDLLFLAVENGHDSSAINLAKRFADGRGLPRSRKDAMKLLRKYSEKDRHLIRLELGSALIEGRYGEHDTNQGLIIMETLCDDGYVSAKRYLGVQFIEGMHIAKDISRGFAYLESAVLEGDTDAMIELGKYLVESSEFVGREAEGVQLLVRADEAGDYEASFELAKLYLDGTVVDYDLEEGMRLIHKADIVRYVPAMVFFAQELISGKLIEKDEEAAKQKLMEVGARDRSELVRLGLDVFYKQGLHQWASWCFLTAFKSGSADAGNNLAYMVRRGEVPKELEVPNPLALLAMGAKEGDGYSLVNQALCNASGIGTKIDWVKADQCIQKVPNLLALQSDSNEEDKEVHPMKWWHFLANDPKHAAEGHLVLGWLVRHGKIEDPEGMKSTERFRLAQEGGWDIPATWFE